MQLFFADLMHDVLRPELSFYQRLRDDAQDFELEFALCLGNMTLGGTHKVYTIGSYEKKYED